jgi:hypothetical protein
MKPSPVRVLLVTAFGVIDIIAVFAAHSEQITNSPVKVQFSSSVTLRKIDPHEPDTVVSLTLGRWDDQFLKYQLDHLENLYDPDRTHDDYARDVLRSGRRAVTKWANNLPIVRETGRRIEERVNESLNAVFRTVKNWFALDITPPREEEPYGSIYEENRFNYKLKLNLSTDPSLEVRAFHAAKIRLYFDEVRASYDIPITEFWSARLGVVFPFDEHVVEPYVRIQHSWENGELGMGVRARHQEKEDANDIYGGVFLAMRF